MLIGAGGIAAALTMLLILEVGSSVVVNEESPVPPLSASCASKRPVPGGPSFAADIVWPAAAVDGERVALR